MSVLVGLGALVARGAAKPGSDVLRRSFQTAGFVGVTAPNYLRWLPNASPVLPLSSRQGLLHRRMSGGGGDGGGASGQESEAELTALTVPVLKQRLREMGLPVSGKKADLVQRILAAGGPTPAPASQSTTTTPPPPRLGGGGGGGEAGWRLSPVKAEVCFSARPPSCRV
eukprot:Tamp_26721.p1 GENE.Tamp_26721~~Tamp_26721.p1  ORF type:complete len:183 (-),score=24.04 Tamp_26721:336-842(-)